MSEKVILEHLPIFVTDDAKQFKFQVHNNQAFCVSISVYYIQQWIGYCAIVFGSVTPAASVEA